VSPQAKRGITGAGSPQAKRGVTGARSPQAKRGVTGARSPAAEGLTVAVTGPTGEIGKPFLRALDRARDVKKIVGMARRPFDPASMGLSKKVVYRQGDVTNREDVDGLVRGADVVVHLAFIILAGSEESRQVNLVGSRNVFEATAASKRAERLVYASSVAAYGFHADNPQPLTEDVPPRGTETHPYSAMKAEVEALLHEVVGEGAYVFRPCIVAGPEAPILIKGIPYVQLRDRLPAAVRRVLDGVPGLRPVLPDPGVPFQLVHHDDVAAALVAGVLGRGEPGTYNLAGPGQIGMKDLADALGYYSVPIPDLAVDATAELVARLPFLPHEASWIEAARVPVLMDTAKARRALRWRPKHEALETLQQTVAATRV
jgi:nucleoside-diphosphate-sugar epimerase